MEPMLVVAELKYHMESGIDIKQICKPWDIWYLYFDWSGTTNEGEIVTHADADHGRIERSRLKAVPLYIIRKIELRDFWMMCATRSPQTYRVLNYYRDGLAIQKFRVLTASSIVERTTYIERHPMANLTLALQQLRQEREQAQLQLEKVGFSNFYWSP